MSAALSSLERAVETESGPERSAPVAAGPALFGRGLSSTQSVLAMQRAAGNAAVARHLAAARQPPPADPVDRPVLTSQSASPTLARDGPALAQRNPGTLDDTQLAAELDSTSRWVDSHQPTEPGYNDMLDYANRLSAERTRRGPAAGGAGGTGRGPTPGRPRLQVVEEQGVPFLVTVPPDAGPASGQVDADRAQDALRRHGVSVVSAEQVRAVAQFMAAQPPASASGPPASPGGAGAGAMPTGSTIQYLMGRFYPFARPLSETELTRIRSQRIVHLTQPAAVEGIQATGLRPSQGFFLNMTDPRVRNNIWTFIGEPSGGQVGINLAGRGGRAQQAAVVIEGSNLPGDALFRPLDGALMLPGQYTGERAYFAPGEPVPAPPAALSGPVAPASSVPPTLASEFNRSGAFSGHPLAAGGTSAVLVMALDTGIYVMTRQELPPPEHVLATGFAGGAGGVAGAVAEQAAARALVSAFGQASGRLVISLGRGAAGGVGGAVAGPIVETLLLALDDRSHTGGEYAAAAGRGLLAGAAGGLVGAALTGALAGSVAPGVGTAIGFVAGAATYMLVNWLLQ